MKKLLLKVVGPFWPVGIDSEPVRDCEQYKEALALKTSVTANCAGKELNHVLTVLERQYDDSHSRRDQISTRAQSLIQLTSALAALIYTGVGGALITSMSTPSPTSRIHWFALAYAIAAMFFLFVIQCALKSLAFRQYKHPDVEGVLKAGKTEEKAVNAELALSLIPATAFNEEQNNRKATILNYAYFYLRVALWGMFLIAAGAVVLKVLEVL